MMSKLRVLIADDDTIFCKLTADLISKAGYEVQTATSVWEAQHLLASQSFDLMMQDMCFPALQDGFGMLEEVHEKYPDLLVLMISGSGHIPDAVNAIKCGATDFIEKPIAKEHLLIRLSRLSEKISMAHNMRDVQVSAIGMIGTSPAMQKVYDAIIQAAKYDSPVLITGETGVGKELAANAIHRLSPLSAKNMVTINCASIPRELFEAELFGYERGAFTGAVTTRKGYFEFAQGASIFLDEVGEWPLEVQAKLLRVIAEGEIQKIGGKPKKISTRIISASNRNLPDLARANAFRLDLLYRINTIQIEIPSLKQRPEDIIPLAEHFMNNFCNRNQITPKEISPAAAAWLMEHSFPGNVRELKNTVERAVIFAKNDHLTVVDFTTSEGDSSLPGPSYREAILAFERQYLESALRKHDGNISQTALYLQMDKSNLFKKMTTLGIQISRK
jgi:DNA-binding NtrC family response regulator